MTVFVILFGSVVRISESGAGCGQRWPTCEASFIQGALAASTLIELTHRLTSGLLFVLYLGLAVATARALPRSHAARWFSLLSLAFVIMEAVMGMMLVRYAWVGTNASSARMVAMPLHFVNTLLLLGAASASAFFCWTPRHQETRNLPLATFLGLALLAYLVVAASGAVTALGDTVFPISSTHTNWARRVSEHALGNSPLQRGRTFHPFMAALLLGTFTGLRQFFRGPSSAASRVLLRLIMLLLTIAACAGVLNISLSAPAFMQLLHLLVACLLWILLIFGALELLSPRIPLETLSPYVRLASSTSHHSKGAPNIGTTMPRS